MPILSTAKSWLTLSYWTDEYAINKGFFNASLGKLWLINSVLALIYTPLSALLFLLREIQTGWSFSLYALNANEVRYPAAEASKIAKLKYYVWKFLSAMASLPITLLNGATFAIQAFRVTSKSESNKAAATVLLQMIAWLALLGVPIFLSMFSPWVDPVWRLLFRLEWSRNFFISFLGQLLQSIWIMLFLVLPVLPPIFRTISNNTLQTVLSVAASLGLAALAFYASAPFSFAWATLNAWYIAEPLFLFTAPLPKEPFYFEYDATFNEAFEINLLLDKKFAQLSNLMQFGTTPSAQRRAIDQLDDLFSQFTTPNTDPGIQLRFYYHLLVTLHTLNTKNPENMYRYCEYIFYTYNPNAFIPAHKKAILRFVEPQTQLKTSKTEKLGNTEITTNFTMSHTNPYQRMFREIGTLWQGLERLLQQPVAPQSDKKSLVLYSADPQKEEIQAYLEAVELALTRSRDILHAHHRQIPRADLELVNFKKQVQNRRAHL